MPTCTWETDGALRTELSMLNTGALVIHSNDGEASLKIHFSNEADNHNVNDETPDNGENNISPPVTISVDTSGYTTNKNGMVVLQPNKQMQNLLQM